MSWLDIVSILVFAGVTAVCSERRITGLVVGLGALVVYRPLLALADVNTVVALVAALAVGLGLGLLGRRINPQGRGGVAVQRVLGGVGGSALALVTVLALSTSLPLGTTAAGSIRYPPVVPEPFTAAVRDSRLLELGRDILLYPLLEQQGFFDSRAPAQRAILQGLHGYLTLGEPWETR